MSFDVRLRQGRIGLRISSAPRAQHGPVEIVVVSGFYQMFAAINQGFDISSAKAGGRL
jgi:hypothetical protein